MTEPKVQRVRDICKVSYCELKVVRRGYCQRHWQQWHLTGRIRRNSHDRPVFRNRGTYSEVALRDRYGNIVGWSQIDTADIELVSRHPWCLRRGGYVGSTSIGDLHRFLMNAKPGEVVHHINRNRKDNRRANLIVTTTRVNNRETHKARKVGVTRLESGKWLAGITATFDTYAEAVRMRKLWEHQAGWHD